MSYTYSSKQLRTECTICYHPNVRGGLATRPSCSLSCRKGPRACMHAACSPPAPTHRGTDTTYACRKSRLVPQTDETVRQKASLTSVSHTQAAACCFSFDLALISAVARSILPPSTVCSAAALETACAGGGHGAPLEYSLTYWPGWAREPLRRSRTLRPWPTFATLSSLLTKPQSPLTRGPCRSSRTST